MKRCPRCGETKPLDQFNRSSKSRDGRGGYCRACSRSYFMGRRERENARRRERYEASKESEAERTRKWRKANGERLSDYRREYHQNNPHIQWMVKHRKRCRRLGIEPVIEHFTKPDVIDRYGDSCFYCEAGEFEHLDHFMPVSKGGPHTLDNVRPSCVGCNLSKSDMTEAEWLAEQAELDDLTEDELDDLIDAEIERWTK